MNYPETPRTAATPPVQQAVQLSRLDTDEIISSGLSGLIAARPGAVKLALPVQMVFRAVYLFIEAVPTTATDDWEFQAEIEFRRNGIGIHSMPASIADNDNGSGTVSQSRLTAFANAAAGTPDCMYVTLSAPLTGGVSGSALTPQRVQLEADEVWLNILGSRVEGAGTFAGWRALLAVRSSLVPL